MPPRRAAFVEAELIAGGHNIAKCILLIETSHPALIALGKTVRGISDL
jgi:hypothetical protein